jgi:hypothetical protein
MKQKIKDGKAKIFNLSQEEHYLIEQLTRTCEFKSQSDFIGWLVRNFAISKDPDKELEMLHNDRIRITNQLKELEEAEAELIKRKKAYKENQKHRDQQKIKAIEIIKRKIMEGLDRFEIEDVAKYWAFRLNIDMAQLIYEAGMEIKKMPKQCTHKVTNQQ